MQISPKDIQSVEEAGMLDGHPVKLIRTTGGFIIAIGKPKGKSKEEALSAGSHGAIVKFDLEKRYPNFQPAMMKSQYFSDTAVVEKHSHFLEDNLRKNGHDIYSVQDGPEVSFHITKHNVKIAAVSGSIENDFLIIKELDVPKEFSRGLAGATVEKALSCKAGLKFKK